MTVKKFVKRPVVIEAIQWTGKNIEEIWEWAGTDVVYGPTELHPQKLKVMTSEGDIFASTDDWIIKGVAGEFYPCKPEIFEATTEDTCTETIFKNVHVGDVVHHVQPSGTVITAMCTSRVEQKGVAFRWTLGPTIVTNPNEPVTILRHQR